MARGPTTCPLCNAYLVGPGGLVSRSILRIGGVLYVFLDLGFRGKGLGFRAKYTDESPELPSRAFYRYGCRFFLLRLILY